MAKIQKDPALVDALKQLNTLHEQASKRLLADEEITKTQNNYHLINNFIRDTEASYRKSNYDGISGSKTLKDLKITSGNIDQYVIKNEALNESLTISSVVRSQPIKELKDRKRELNAYLKKNKENKRLSLFAKSVHELIEIRKELKIREKTKNEVKLTIGIEPKEFYRKYNSNLLEKQEKNRLQEKIKKSYRTLIKKEKISQEEITTFHNDLCSYIDKAGLRSPNSFYDMRTSKTAARKGINVINAERSEDTDALSDLLTDLTDKKLKKHKKHLNALLKNNSNNVGNRDFNAGLNEVAVYKEELEIRKRLSKLDKLLGIDAKKIYTKPTSLKTEKENRKEKWLEMRDKFRPLDSPHLSKYESILIEKVLDDVEQRKESIKSESSLDHLYATIESREERQSDTASRVSSVPDNPIASSSERTHAKAAPASAAHIPPPPPMPPERPIEAINNNTAIKENPREKLQDGAHSDKEESLYTEVDHSSKINRSSEAKNQAAMRNTNLETVNSGLDMNELRAALAVRINKVQQEENNHKQLNQHQNPETKHSIAALTGTPSKTPPPPQNPEKQQPIETLKALASSQSESLVNPDSVKDKIKYFEQNLRFQ
jgi:hypothetical protein